MPQSNLCGDALVAYEKMVHDLPRDDYQEQVTLDGLLRDRVRLLDLVESRELEQQRLLTKDLLHPDHPSFYSVAPLSGASSTTCSHQRRFRCTYMRSKFTAVQDEVDVGKKIFQADPSAKTFMASVAAVWWSVVCACFVVGRCPGQ